MLLARLQTGETIPLDASTVLVVGEGEDVVGVALGDLLQLEFVPPAISLLEGENAVGEKKQALVFTDTDSGVRAICEITPSVKREMIETLSAPSVQTFRSIPADL